MSSTIERSKSHISIVMVYKMLCYYSDGIQDVMLL